MLRLLTGVAGLPRIERVVGAVKLDLFMLKTLMYVSNRILVDSRDLQALPLSFSPPSVKMLHCFVLLRCVFVVFGLLGSESARYFNVWQKVKFLIFSPITPSSGRSTR